MKHRRPLCLSLKKFSRVKNPFPCLKMPVFPMPEKLEKGVHMFAKMYAITAITRCMYCSRYLYKQERRISMLESLTSSKILEYKNTEEGSCGAKSSFEPVWIVPKYNG